MTKVERVKRKAKERGAGLVEYVVLIALIAVVCLGGVAALGGSNRSLMDSNASSFASSD